MLTNARVLNLVNGTAVAFLVLVSGCGKSAHLRGEGPNAQGAPKIPQDSNTTPDVSQKPTTPPVVVQKPTTEPPVVVSKPSPVPTPQTKPTPVVVQKPTHCYQDVNYKFPMDTRYHVVREGGYFTAFVRGVDSVYADFTNLYAAFGTWAGMRFNGGYIENGRYVAADYIFHIVRSGTGLVGVVSSDNASDRVVGTVETTLSPALLESGTPQKVVIRLRPDVCLVQYGDSAGNLVSGGAGWLLLQ